MSAFQKLGRYLILEEIAKGGMAVIYRGKLLGAAGFEKEVAIKKILPFWSQNEDFISMLIDEAKILVELHHPNIVQVIELGKEDNSYFIVMEFVNGFDLRSLIRNLQKKDLKLSLEFITYVTKQICLGLDFAHNKSLNDKDLKIVHRDISPQNILIGKEGDVKITDFGIAKTTQKTNHTQTGVLKGKFAYMSPEQAVGEDIDHQTDIFALGILFYEMLFDQKCFDGKNDFEIIEKVKRAEIHYPDDLAKEVRTILEKSLAIDKSQRYQHAIDFYHDLETLESTFDKKVYSRDFRKFLQEHFKDQFKQPIAHTTISEEATALHETNEDSYKVLTSVTEVFDKTQIDAPKTLIFKEQNEDVIQTQIQTVVQEKNFTSQPKRNVFTSKPSLTILLFLITVTASTFAGLWLRSDSAPSQSSKIVTEQTQPSESLAIANERIVADTQKRLNPIAATLTPKDPEPKKWTANLSLKTQPENATITWVIDNKEQTSKHKIEKRFEITEKPLKIPITVSAKGFHNQKIDVVFDKDNLQFKKEITLLPIEYGKFYLYSRPWATFRIKDFDNKSYPSSKTLTIPVGEYRLSVFSPSQKRSSGRKITIKKDQTLSCLASFASRSTISCRYK